MAVDSNFLVVIFDFASKPELLPFILVFLHAYTALPGNQVLVIGRNGAIVSPADAETAPGLAKSRPPTCHAGYWKMDQEIMHGWKESLAGNASLAGCIALALMYCNKKSLVYHSVSFRILLLSESRDDPAEHIAMMNAIFAAQRKEVPIDVCRLATHESLYLPQASSLTNGIHHEIKDPKLLVHSLLHIYLANREMRDVMALSKNDKIDFRATCFCHGHNVDMGFVCSVCLSIYCKVSETCPTCSSPIYARS
ncbi:RNA polymerase II transcription factor B subunit 4 [Kappamyces sp. JEL0829]|nr:RNA polymerase II transcription factor B subunit 4 [Kappamyces sp. JEL0829]